MSLLRSLFGPGKDEMWRQLCDEIGADFREVGFFRKSKVQLQQGDWIITLDTYSQSDGENNKTYTRIRAPFVNPDGFGFRIYRAGFFSELGKKVFGMEDIEVGHPRFDRDFIIKSNSPRHVRMLFSNERLRELVQMQEAIRLSVKKDDGWFGASFPDGVDELYFEVSGVIKDTKRLKQLFELFVEFLNHLCHLGAAYEDDADLLIATLLAPGGLIETDVILWDGDPPRHSAAEALGRLKDAKGVPPLASVLDDEDRRLRAIALEALVEIGDAGAVPALIPLLGDLEWLEKDAATGQAAEALRKLGAGDFVEAFESALAGNIDPLKRFLEPYRAEILGALTNLVQGPVLSAEKAARTLRDIGATEAVPALRTRARTLGKQDRTRAVLENAIADLESRASLPRPAQARAPGAGSLPRPTGEPGTHTDTLPRALDDEPDGDDS